MRSRSIWKSLLEPAGIWFRETGSLLIARRTEEMAVLEEFMQMDGRPSARIMTPLETTQRAPEVRADGLLGSLWSADELIVDPREAITALPGILSARYPVTFLFQKTVTRIEHPAVYMGTERLEGDLIFVCSGPDLETLYPELFERTPITKCKLQMMRTAPQPNGWQLGASLCAGLTLIHYKSFENTPSLPRLKDIYAEAYPEQVKWGIHVLVSQNGSGVITLGDTHEYGLHLDPFNRKTLNDRVLSYLDEFAAFPSMEIAEYWHGIYPKMTNGATEFVAAAVPGVTVVNGLGGAGMTLSFGLAEEIISKI